MLYIKTNINRMRKKEEQNAKEKTAMELPQFNWVKN